MRPLIQSLLKNSATKKTPENDHLTVRIMHAWGMCALVISPQGAAKLLTECFPLAGPDQQIFLFGQDRHIPPIGIDAMINLRLQQMRLVAYGVVPPAQHDTKQ